MSRRVAQTLLGDQAHEWMDEAACKDLPSALTNDLFFDERIHDPLKATRHKLCGDCPVRVDCQEFGDEISPNYGAFGGLTGPERRIERRYKGKAPRPEQIRAEYEIYK